MIKLDYSKNEFPHLQVDLVEEKKQVDMKKKQEAEEKKK